jgi:hypothetical protein
MAVADDLRTLATEDVVYLTKQIGIAPQPTAPPSQLEVFKGRLRQTGQGEWVFTSFTGQSGLVGLTLGTVQPDWTSSETPSQGLEVRIPVVVVPANYISSGIFGTVQIPAIIHVITLTTVIPSDFAE